MEDMRLLMKKLKQDKANFNLLKTQYMLALLIYCLHFTFICNIFNVFLKVA